MDKWDKLSAEKLTPEFQTRFASKRHLAEWLVPKLAPLGDDAETIMEVIAAHMSACHADGVRDAAYVAKQIADVRPASREAAALVKALAELEQRSRQDVSASPKNDESPAQPKLNEAIPCSQDDRQAR